MAAIIVLIPVITVLFGTAIALVSSEWKGINFQSQVRMDLVKFSMHFHRLVIITGQPLPD